MMQCPDCQLEIPTDSVYCCYCGQALQRCTDCERFYDLHAAFCGNCGSGLVIPDGPQDKGEGFDPPEQLLDGVTGFLYDVADQSKHHPLYLGDNTVGAGGHNDIHVDRPPVSWNHAIIICRDDRVLLQDSASTNGTFVNHERIDSIRHLSHRDTIRFGSEDFRLWLPPSFRSSGM